MKRSTFLLTILVLGAAVMTPTFSVASGTSQEPMRQIPPTTIIMQLPDEMGAMERPGVEFDHQKHSQALEQDGCATCHTLQDGVLKSRFSKTDGAETRGAVIDAYHDGCMSCHKTRVGSQQPSGPVTCGECHVRREEGVSRRAPMAFDYSLHGRHTLAAADKCETCHHVFDEEKQSRVYFKGQEDACRSCHGPVDEGKKLSLRNAAHQACVSCHLQRMENQADTGPATCDGCHDAAIRQSIKRLEEIPRIQRGQADRLWVQAQDAKSASVPFDHVGHERFTQACSNCHHQTLKKCVDCHPISGALEGQGVTLEQAYHSASSDHSCVGCHATATQAVDCAGCHGDKPTRPAETTCVICHSGPRPPIAEEGGPSVVIPSVEANPLPPTSDDFPEEVVIDVIADAYQPSKLPHRKIVERLNKSIEENRMAKRFHATSQTMCSGCHHQSPAGTRPPQCRACHGTTAHPTLDKPSLKAAYHQQCIGCHQRMNVENQGCTDCHEVREEQS